MSVMDPCLARTFDARAEFSLGLFRFSPKGAVDSRGLRRGVGQVPFGLLSEPRNCNTSDKWHECSDCEDYTIAAKWEWDLLAHVCQSWRQIVLVSPRRLNLRIFCAQGTPVRKNIGIWPAFPIVIDYSSAGRGITPDDEDNIVAALEPQYLDRVCHLEVAITGSLLGKMATVMQEPFPVLTCLDISLKDGNAPVLPAKFLGGSAPRLLWISLRGILISALPTLLLSASALVALELRKIPPTGYISPDAMVASLAALPGLRYFVIGFQSATL